MKPSFFHDKSSFDSKTDIVQLLQKEPEAVDEVLRHSSKRIRFAALENGHVNIDTEDSIKQRLITALFQFRFN